MTAAEWSPDKYAEYADLRLQPALDLLARVPELPPGEIVDLGCGNGAAAAALAGRFAARRLIGVDNSASMLAHAAAGGHYTGLMQSDAATWSPHRPPALIFANSVCHWLDDHQALFARFARALLPGGALAVQMPRQYDAPSHRAMRELAGALFPDRFDFRAWRSPVSAAIHYARLLAPLGAAQVWETEYMQRLDAVNEGHPVRHFTQSTAMRPFTAELDNDETKRFVAAYEEALAAAYPVEPDGSVLFPFRRLFFVLKRDGG